MQNRTEQNRTEQNRTEQNRTEQNRTEQNRTEQNRTEQLRGRFSGLDLYRIIAMLMITTLHIVNQHYGLLNDKIPQKQYCFGMFLEYACYCGVNCFALLTGFFLGEKPVEYNQRLIARFLSLYAQIVIWGILLYGIGRLIFPQTHVFSIKQIILFFLPFRSSWWYVDAYMNLLFFLPILACFTACSSAFVLFRTGLVFFAISCVIPFAHCYNAMLCLGGGYSVVWLMICFIWGAMIRKNMEFFYSWRFCRIAALAVAVSCAVIPYVLHTFFGKGFMSYTSPFCVLEAMALLIYFYGIKIKNPWLSKIICFASVNALGIYLFQNHSSVWREVICQNDPYIWPFHFYLWAIPVWIIGIAVIGIFLNWGINVFMRLCGIMARKMWFCYKP